MAKKESAAKTKASSASMAMIICERIAAFKDRLGDLEGAGTHEQKMNAHNELSSIILDAGNMLAGHSADDADAEDVSTEEVDKEGDDK